MRIVVLGSEGMLGHKMLAIVRKHFNGVVGLSRKDGLNAVDIPGTSRLIAQQRPSVVINCVGLIKQRPHNLASALAVNAEFPQHTKIICGALGARLVHFSTDCVFSGEKGNYKEQDTPDPVDDYGMSKFLGEVYGDNVLTLRTSIVGREKANGYGLLEWFLRQSGQIIGHKNATWTGVTTNWLAGTTARLLWDHPSLHGLYQVASPAVSKFRLLQIFQEVYEKKDVIIEPVDRPICDRSLNGEAFTRATRITTPHLLEQIQEMRGQDQRSEYAFR